jgi:hypothetical protein
MVIRGKFCPANIFAAETVEQLPNTLYCNMKTIVPDNPPKAIEREISTFRLKYAEIKKHEGEFVLIQGDAVVEYYPSYGDALNDGYKRFRDDTFLVQEVGSEPVVLNRCGVVKKDDKLRVTRSKKH